MNRLDIPQIVPIRKISFESGNTVTLEIRLEKVKLDIKPGQYLMVWNPGDDEIPISVSNIINERIFLTICGVGKTTDSLVTKQKDDLIGLRGPFGNGFKINKSKSISVIVAGGMGIAPLRYLLYNLNNCSNKEIILIQGARTEAEIYFRLEFENMGLKCHYCTDDGSLGAKVFPTEILEDILDQYDYNNIEIFTCGPERMLKKVLDIVTAQNLERNTQFSLERYIRCGFGICGSCYMDGLGLSVCKDGPVFNGNVLLELDDFGKWGRNPDGSKFHL